MDVGADQLALVATLGTALAVGLGLFFLMVVLGRRIWAWIFGASTQSRENHTMAPVGEPKSEADYPIPVTATDLFAIRSNLGAVARQLEDLERKLREASNLGDNVLELKRK